LPQSKGPGSAAHCWKTPPEESKPSEEDQRWLVAQQAPQAAQPAVPTAPTNGRPLTLVEIVEHQAAGYRAWGTPAGDFLARQLDRLGQLIRFMSAKTPEEFEERLEVLEADARENRYQLGYADGLEDGRQEFGRCWVE
jgi:hypothetical protein